MKLNEFQISALKTDSISWGEADGRAIALLGILGELGSVAGVVKKHLRDGKAYNAFTKDLTEELGDLLWYVAVTSHHLGLTLDDEPGILDSTSSFDAVDALATDVYGLVTDEALSAFFQTGQDVVPGKVKTIVSRILVDMNSIARLYGLDIGRVAETNAAKTPLFFTSNLESPAPQFDANCKPYEILPRQFEIDFIEAGSGKSIMQMNGVNIGDKITDNAYVDDGYRFHDVFHLANAATLGWSPVFRRMLHRKRKSVPAIDENEDGARAAIVEELVVNLIFNYVKQNKFLEDSQEIDIGILKQIMGLVEGLEVQSVAAWEWKHCIVQGCDIFRQLKLARVGRVAIDAERRLLEFSDA